MIYVWKCPRCLSVYESDSAAALLCPCSMQPVLAVFRTDLDDPLPPPTTCVPASVILWCPTMRMASFAERYINRRQVTLVVGSVERLRGFRVDRIYVYDPTSLLPASELVYATTRGDVKFLAV